MLSKLYVFPEISTYGENSTSTAAISALNCTGNALSCSGNPIAVNQCDQKFSKLRGGTVVFCSIIISERNKCTNRTTYRSIELFKHYWTVQ